VFVRDGRRGVVLLAACVLSFAATFCPVRMMPSGAGKTVRPLGSLPTSMPFCEGAVGTFAVCVLRTGGAGTGRFVVVAGCAVTGARPTWPMFNAAIRSWSV
jgi:hypothetical protein